MQPLERRKQMNSILNKTKLGSNAGGRPPVAVEIMPEGVLAASQPSPGGEPHYAFMALPSGTVIPGIDQPNLHMPETVGNAIRAALGQLSLRSRFVSVILPDTSVRVFMLDFDSFPPKPAEAIAVLRIRLRKMVPFDVEHAGVSYQILSEQKGECKVLAAIVPGPILAEYEAAVRVAGFEPGAVLPSSLTALEVAGSMEAVLSANLTQKALTTTIANGQDLLLYRTIDLPDDPDLRKAEIQRGIAVTSAYFEDKLNVKPRQLYYTGTLTPQEFASWIDDPELTVVELAPRPETGTATALGNVSIAGVAGALAGVS